MHYSFPRHHPLTRAMPLRLVLLFGFLIWGFTKCYSADQPFQPSLIDSAFKTVLSPALSGDDFRITPRRHGHSAVIQAGTSDSDVPPGFAPHVLALSLRARSSHMAEQAIPFFPLPASTRYGIPVARAPPHP